MSTNTTPPPLDLSHLPPTFLLPTHLTPSQISTLEAQLRKCSCPLASFTKAHLFLADINTTKRCEFELRGRGLKTAPLSSKSAASSGELIRVVKLKWFTESFATATLLRIESYTMYTASIVSRAPSPSQRLTADEKRRKEILERARKDAERNAAEGERYTNDRPRFVRHRNTDELVGSSPRQRRDMEQLLELSKSMRVGRRPSTPEFEDALVKGRELEDMPVWVKRKIRYSHLRTTPASSPNYRFISQLRTIRLIRILASDDVGTRAYSTMIASLQSYPYPLTTASEIVLLPGCDSKASQLLSEYLHSSAIPGDRYIPAVRELEASESFKTLKMFSEVYGVGPAGAREWYYDNRWRSLDNVVEFGWSGLSRNRQIGVKYYDEFLAKISRDEAERIGGIIGRHAAGLRSGMEYTLAGEYRRGEEEIGDVDVLLSYPEGAVVQGGFMKELVLALEREGWVTHILHIGRGVEDMDGREDRPQEFDRLEKALVVWQEAEFDDGTRTPMKSGKNGNLHRRVSIVLVPPGSVGTALLRWTGAATFDRDLRLWCEKDIKWEFTSEGVFDENDGEKVRVVDAVWRSGEQMEEAERRVFKGLALEWVKPEERCTG